MENDDFDDFELEQEQPQEAFHIEADIYDSGDMAHLLVVPCNNSYIVTGNDEHLCTLVKTCDEPECWEQQEGGLDEEIVERIGMAIQDYVNSLQ